MNKESVLITPDVIEDCLCESFDIVEKNTFTHNRIPKLIEIAS